MSTAFPNLPYFVHNGRIITESDAIIEYIVQVSGRNELLGKGEDIVTVTQVRGVIKDIFLILT